MGVGEGREGAAVDAVRPWAPASVAIARPPRRRLGGWILAAWWGLAGAQLAGCGVPPPTGGWWPAGDAAANQDQAGDAAAEASDSVGPIGGAAAVGDGSSPAETSVGPGDADAGAAADHQAAAAETAVVPGDAIDDAADQLAAAETDAGADAADAAADGLTPLADSADGAASPADADSGSSGEDSSTGDVGDSAAASSEVLDASAAADADGSDGAAADAGPPPCSEGESCDDGNPCTTKEFCLKGVCLFGAMVNCDDGQPCTNDVCGATGCAHLPAQAPCSDGNACTTGDACVAGQCVGTPKNCADTNPCTTESCVNGQCKLAAVASGTPCPQGVCADMQCVVKPCPAVVQVPGGVLPAYNKNPAVSIAPFWVDNRSYIGMEYDLCAKVGACTPGDGKVIPIQYKGSCSTQSFPPCTVGYCDCTSNYIEAVSVDAVRAAQFCAWKGGRLLTLPEVLWAAYGKYDFAANNTATTKLTDVPSLLYNRSRKFLHLSITTTGWHHTPHPTIKNLYIYAETDYGYSAFPLSTTTVGTLACAYDSKPTCP